MRLNQRNPKKNTSNFKDKKEKEKYSTIIIIPVTFVCIDELFPTSSSKKNYFTQDYTRKINQNKNKNQPNSTRLVWLHHYMENICKIIFISNFTMLISLSIVVHSSHYTMNELLMNNWLTVSVHELPFEILSWRNSKLTELPQLQAPPGVDSKRLIL